MTLPIGQMVQDKPLSPEIIDLDGLLLGRAGYEKTYVAMTPLTCLINAAPSAVHYRPTAPSQIETTVAALDGIASARETRAEALPHGGILVTRTCLLHDDAKSEHITLSLEWFPDVSGRTRMNVIHETGAGKFEWSFGGHWTLGEVARLLLR